MTRWCSACVKIDVMRRVIPALYGPEAELVVCTGERREESANRAKYVEREVHACDTKRRRVEAWRPVIDYSEADVWAALEKHRVQPHPCYELGYPRCSCQICIFGSANIWASNAELAPEKIDYIDRRERELGFTLYAGRTIREHVARGRSFLRAEKKARWAAEAMSEFRSPIFVENWRLPQGAFSAEKGGSV